MRLQPKTASKVFIVWTGPRADGLIALRTGIRGHVVVKDARFQGPLPLLMDQPGNPVSL